MQIVLLWELVSLYIASVTPMKTECTSFIAYTTKRACDDCITSHFFRFKFGTFSARCKAGNCSVTPKANSAPLHPTPPIHSVGGYCMQTNRDYITLVGPILSHQMLIATLGDGQEFGSFDLHAVALNPISRCLSPDTGDRIDLRPRRPTAAR